MVKEYVNQFKDLVDYFIICTQDGEELEIPSEDAEFENELTKLYFDTYKEVGYVQNTITPQQREEYERYQDIASGIIIL